MSIEALADEALTDRLLFTIQIRNLESQNALISDAIRDMRQEIETLKGQVAEMSETIDRMRRLEDLELESSVQLAIDQSLLGR